MIAATIAGLDAEDLAAAAVMPTMSRMSSDNFWRASGVRDLGSTEATQSAMIEVTGSEFAKPGLSECSVPLVAWPLVAWVPLAVMAY